MTITPGTPETWYNKTWLVVLLYLFFFPVGLYALWKSSKISKGWKVAGTALIGLFIIAAAMGKPETAKQSNGSTAASATPKAEPGSATEVVVDDKSSSKDEPAKTEGHLFESTDDFKDAFNKYCSSNNFDLSIDDIEVKEGDVKNTFQYMFTDNLGVIGSVDNSDGKVIEVMLKGSGDGTAKSGANILIGITALISTVDPSLQPEKRGQILKDLGLFGDKKKDIMDLDDKTEMNGIKYFVSSSKNMGLMVGASRN